jgi:signal transduction histidine kinase
MYFNIFLVLGITITGQSEPFLFRKFAPEYDTHYTITKEALARSALRYITGATELSDENTNRNARSILYKLFGKGMFFIDLKILEN